MRFLLLAVLAASLCGCNIVYKLPTRQGNVIEQADLDKLKPGMTREQVRFIMGTPMAANSMQPSRWEYLGYYKNPHGKVFTRTVTLYFEGDSLARIVGAEPPPKTGQDPDVAPTAEAEADPEPRPEPPSSGVVITPE